MKLENITICQQCGCVFSPYYAMSVDTTDLTGKEFKVVNCPVCKHEYEFTNKLIR